MELTLTKEEAELIEELLLIELNTLPVEIHHCRISEYKEMLKKKQTLVSGLLEKVKKLL
ncbi:MAG: hypothetical protein N2316_09000 [Spirochaetes bacterium]|nr:hypothetical protein [Spirochaetota bacterium]